MTVETIERNNFQYSIEILLRGGIREFQIEIYDYFQYSIEILFKQYCGELANYGIQCIEFQYSIEIFIEYLNEVVKDA